MISRSPSFTPLSRRAPSRLSVQKCTTKRHMTSTRLDGLGLLCAQGSRFDHEVPVRQGDAGVDELQGAFRHQIEGCVRVHELHPIVVAEILLIPRQPRVGASIIQNKGTKGRGHRTNATSPWEKKSVPVHTCAYLCTCNVHAWTTLSYDDTRRY